MKHAMAKLSLLLLAGLLGLFALSLLGHFGVFRILDTVNDNAFAVGAVFLLVGLLSRLSRKEGGRGMNYYSADVHRDVAEAVRERARLSTFLLFIALGLVFILGGAFLPVMRL